MAYVLHAAMQHEWGAWRENAHGARMHIHDKHVLLPRKQKTCRLALAPQVTSRHPCTTFAAQKLVKGMHWHTMHAAPAVPCPSMGRSKAEQLLLAWDAACFQAAPGNWT